MVKKKNKKAEITVTIEMPQSPETIKELQRRGAKAIIENLLKRKHKD